MVHLLERLFGLRRTDTTVRRELLAGVVAFFTTVYIVVVNASILADAGIPQQAGMVATILASASGCLIMALWAKQPLLLVPGMGINALFSHTLVHALNLSWQEALAAVFTAGVIYTIVSFTALSRTLAAAIPSSLKAAISVGIGLFLTLIGLQKGGIVTLQDGSLVALAPLGEPQVLLTLASLLITLVVYLRRLPGGFLLSIAVGTLLAFLAGQLDVTGSSQQSSLSLEAYGTLFASLSFGAILSLSFWIAAFALALVVILENIGVMHSQLHLVGKPEALERAMQAGAISVLSCGWWGTSPTVSAAESVAGIAAGGKTGLTALTTGVLFLGSLFLLPVAAFIPDSAIAPVLIIVGGLMAQEIRNLSLDDPSEWFPAFLTIAFIPFSYSIVDGMGFGFVAYPVLKLLAGKGRDVSIPLYAIAGLFLVYFLLQAVGV